MSGGRTFVDSNVLIYAHDVDAGSKRQAAAQALQEFYVNVTRKIASPLPRASARAIVDAYAIWCIDITPAELTAAFRIEDDARIGFWDALIVASALKAGAERILSEDLNAGQKIRGVRIESPFSA